MSDTTPSACKSCRHRYNDVSEGQNCRRLDRRVVVGKAEILKWPGWSVTEAIEECEGKLAQPRLFGRLAYYLGC